MSDVIYPLALIAAQRVTPLHRVVTDDFEAGNTQTRLVWPDKTHKRQFIIEHSPLTLEEYSALRSFHTQRNGTYDYFWYRDNVQRGGNAKVRFGAPVQFNTAKQVHSVNVQLNEVAPLLMDPQLDEVVTAAGNTPLVWYNANRQRYFQHPLNGVATAYHDPAGIYDSRLAYHAAIQAGTNPLANTTGQWQYYQGDGTAWAKTSSNIAEITGSTPALSAFCIARHSAPADDGTDHALFSLGDATGGASAIASLVVSGSGTDAYHVCVSPSSLGQLVGNLSANTWASLAFGWASASATLDGWMNGTVASGTLARTYVAGPLSIHGQSNGTRKMNANVSMANANLSHLLVFNAKLTTAQVKALHNLFAYQFGMSTVS